MATAHATHKPVVLHPPVAPPMTRTYESPVPYERTRIHAAAIYCSDGRIGEHFDDFLQNGLGLPRYDRVALPGGPACLAGHSQAHLEEQGVIDELQFLVEVHGLKKIVLVAHENCAFYATRLELKAPRLELVQRADLVRSAAIVQRVTGLDAIEGYFARLVDGKVVFERVEV
ncbi:MAG: carbonic anhydrase [Phycisphaerales bacterium]